ncbi:hypothetical protein [Burkholderia stagnalis]|uniref:hypothetical protein n=1 Tax=Burkholderia stagnalis TaxID=1503054 RepID=UPI000F583A61|nr:hypothetical protein [Burkholderia stagnalis]RQQ37066.1 hypothetical protein DF163_01470 [Burkholderia stagnalis]RQQ55647.1 hypothetical protein DF162_01725 [Burkholderia stagnalis]RQY19108.1 hypothetical protein DF118_01730 [Burkholderia stagnalis]RQY64207.1 hypothetical protein DF112_00480 [Burkholderia stagnalis]RQY70394.1 hypothetical protein DF109_02300 [Burkholderia stagnalis]
MATETIVSVAAYQDTVVAKIQAAFPDFKTVEFDREENDRDELEAGDLPAILLDLNEFEEAPEADRGTGQLPMRARVEARVVIGYRTARAKTAARTAAGCLAAWLRLRRFVCEGVWTEAAQVIGAYRDDFAPGMDRYVVWRVEWAQVLHLGASVWKEAGAIPKNPSFSFAPDIGLGNEACYQPLFPQGVPTP